MLAFDAIGLDAIGVNGASSSTTPSPTGVVTTQPAPNGQSQEFIGTTTNATSGTASLTCTSGGANVGPVPFTITNNAFDFTISSIPSGSYTPALTLVGGGGSSAVTGTSSFTIVGISGGGTIPTTTKVSADLASSFVVLNAASVDMSVTYAVRNAVSSDMAGTYSVRSATNADLAGAYSVLRGVTSDMTGAYSIIATVSGNFVALYSVLNEVGPIISIRRILDLDNPSDASDFVLRGGVWTIDTDPNDNLLYGLKVFNTIERAGTLIDKVEPVATGPTVTMEPFVKDLHGFVGVMLSGLDMSSDDAVNEFTYRITCANGEQFDTTFALRLKEK